MSGTVGIPERMARRLSVALLSAVAGHQDPAQRAFAVELANVIGRELMRLDRKRERSRPRKASEKASRASKRERRSAVRAAVEKRADGHCECGCGGAFSDSFMNQPEMDHFFGVARAESVETCWMLSRFHHDCKTRNSPNRIIWLEAFVAHAKKHGYVQAEDKARDELFAEMAARKLDAGRAALGSATP